MQINELINVSPVIIMGFLEKRTIQKITIAKEKENEFPPFEKVIVQLRVMKILKNETDKQIPPVISVAEAQWKSELARYKRGVLEGVWVSPVYKSYHPSIPKLEHESIVFLEPEVGQDKDQYKFSVINGYETKNARKEIKEMIKNPA